MVKGGKRRRHGQRKTPVVSDITVNDFADSVPGKHSGSQRVKKGDKSKTIHNKGIPSMSAEAKDTSWFDKDLDDFDITLGRDDDDDEEENVEEKQTAQRKAVSKRKQLTACDDHGVTYPIDLWYQLGRYVLPETVMTFARLCRGTNSIVHSVQFWRNLHIRFYREHGNIPDSLGPESMDCVHGLRARVIRTLHYVYPPLSSRTRTSVPFENEPHCFIGHRCLLVWHKKVKNVWNFCFKFRRGDSVDVSSNERKSLRSRHFLKWHQDLHYNPDNNCAILEVTCSNFVSLPMVMGMLVNRVCLNVSAASMRYHRLKIVFDSSYRTTTAKTQTGMMELVLDPVLELRVYPWWFPQYVESHSFLETEES